MYETIFRRVVSYGLVYNFILAILCEVYFNILLNSREAD